MIVSCFVGFVETSSNSSTPRFQNGHCSSGLLWVISLK